MEKLTGRAAYEAPSVVEVGTFTDLTDYNHALSPNSGEASSSEARRLVAGTSINQRSSCIAYPWRRRTAPRSGGERPPQARQRSPPCG
jgi:hypothetical protein